MPRRPRTRDEVLKEISDRLNKGATLQPLPANTKFYTCDSCGRLITYLLFRSEREIDLCYPCYVAFEKRGNIYVTLKNNQRRQHRFGSEDRLMFFGKVPPIAAEAMENKIAPPINEEEMNPTENTLSMSGTREQHFDDYEYHRIEEENVQHSAVNEKDSKKEETSPSRTKKTRKTERAAHHRDATPQQEDNDEPDTSDEAKKPNQKQVTIGPMLRSAVDSRPSRLRDPFAPRGDEASSAAADAPAAKHKKSREPKFEILPQPQQKTAGGKQRKDLEKDDTTPIARAFSKKRAREAVEAAKQEQPVPPPPPPPAAAVAEEARQKGRGRGKGKQQKVTSTGEAAAAPATIMPPARSLDDPTTPTAPKPKAQLVVDSSSIVHSIHRFHFRTRDPNAVADVLTATQKASIICCEKEIRAFTGIELPQGVFAAYHPTSHVISVRVIPTSRESGFWFSVLSADSTHHRVVVWQMPLKDAIHGTMGAPEAKYSVIAGSHPVLDHDWVPAVLNNTPDPRNNNMTPLGVCSFLKNEMILSAVFPKERRDGGSWFLISELCGTTKVERDKEIDPKALKWTTDGSIERTFLIVMFVCGSTLVYGIAQEALRSDPQRPSLRLLHRIGRRITTVIPQAVSYPPFDIAPRPHVREQLLAVACGFSVSIYKDPDFAMTVHAELSGRLTALSTAENCVFAALDNNSVTTITYAGRDNVICSGLAGKGIHCRATAAPKAGASAVVVCTDTGHCVRVPVDEVRPVVPSCVIQLGRDESRAVHVRHQFAPTRTPGRSEPEWPPRQAEHPSPLQYASCALRSSSPYPELTVAAYSDGALIIFPTTSTRKE